MILIINLTVYSLNRLDINRMSGTILASLKLPNVTSAGVPSYLENLLNNQLLLQNHTQNSIFYNIVEQLKMRYALSNSNFTIKTKLLPVVVSSKAPASYDSSKHEVTVYIVKLRDNTYELRLI